MTTLDERGLSAAASLLEDAGTRPSPSLDDLLRRDQRRPLAPRVVAIAVAVALVALAVLRVRAGVEDPATKPGVPTYRYRPGDLGISMLVPKSWTENGHTPSGFDYSAYELGQAPIGSRGYALATRAMYDWASETPSTFGQARVSFLTGGGAVVTSSEATRVGGQAAWRLRYRLPARPRYPTNHAHVTEYDVVTRTGSDHQPHYIVIVLGQYEPVSASTSRLLTWIASTIRVQH